MAELGNSPLFVIFPPCRIGPHAPAFLTPEALKVVVDTFGLKISDVKNPEADVKAMMAGQ